MPLNVMVQARIDTAIRDRATVVLGNMGLTLSDAVRMLLTRVAREGELPVGLAVDAATHDAWFRDKVREALADKRPAVPHDEVEARFAKRRSAAKASARKRRA